MKDAHIHFHKQPYTLEIVQGMVDAAIKRGVDEINLLDHTSKFQEFKFLYKQTKNEPEMYEHYFNAERKYRSIKEYLDFIELVKSKNWPIKINFGLEVCYFEGAEEQLKEELKKYHFDFLIGSVHHIDGFGYDYGTDKWKGRDVDHLWKRYCEINYSLIKSNLFTHLAHPDALKIYNIYPSFDLHPYYKKVAELLKEHHMSTEDNYGFIRYGYTNYGINRDFLKILLDEGLTVYNSSDAHDFKDVGRFNPLNYCHIEKAVMSDLPRLMEIYQGAREYMKKTNNPDQWGDNWPSKEKIKEDIEVGRSFVVKDDLRIYAVFAFVVGVDQTYIHMIEGEWLSNKEYGTIHRLASSFEINGLFPFIQKYLEENYKVNFRIDTHANNKTMINQILKTGYVYTGLISPIEGGIRNAYEKVIY